MSETGSTGVGVAGAGTTVAGVATLANTGMSVSLILAAATTLIALSIVIFVKSKLVTSK